MYRYKGVRMFLIFAAMFFLLVSCSNPESKTGSQSNQIADESGTSQQNGTDNENTIDNTQENEQSQDKQPGEGEEETSNDGEDPQKAEEDIKPDFIFPSEGLRPIAVMIDNEGTKSLPQGGLHKAQVIYEIIVEGGETRLMPVFWQTNSDMIGPVRSSRHYFLDYSMENDAIYVHFGWSPMAMNDISKYKINNINGVAGRDGKVFWDITKDKNNWQDSFTSMETIMNQVKKVKYRTDTQSKLVFNFRENIEEISEGQKAEKINIKYSTTYTCGYTYDSVSKTYKRIRKGKAQMERTTGEQLEASNIIIQYVPAYPIKGDKEGRMDVKTVGSGKGMLISCGKAIDIKWSKESRTSPTRYVDQNGNDIVLNPGQTWVQVLPHNGSVKIE